ncbi:MAG: hypothetical protein ACR2KB_04815 [Chitinophagaceae bacterium]
MKNLILSKSHTPVLVQPKPLPSLVACLLMDFLGFATFGIPFIGEFLDVLWAPVSALIFWKMFGFRKGFLGGIINFVEELMPGLDFIPTFTIMWFVQYFKRNPSLSLKTLITR